MTQNYHHGRPTLGVLAGWQFYRTATNLSYLAPVFRGISRAAMDLECNVMLGCGIGLSASPADPFRPAWPFLSDEHDYLPIGPWNTDGLIIANPLNSPARSEYVHRLAASGHPVLFIGAGEPGPQIGADNHSGIWEALQHLVQHGHHQIAFIAGSLEDMRGDSGDRLEAYRMACEQYGLDNNPALVAYGRHVFDGGYAAMQQIIQSGASFTAVMASNDESALGAMQALEQAGRKIPQDVAVIGFDNRLEGAEHEPGLTSIHVPLFNIGYQAVDLLLRHIKGEAVLGETVKVKTRLVVRQSCGCSVAQYFSPGIETILSEGLLYEDQHLAALAKNINIAILNQAHSLTEEDGYACCLRLVKTFTSSLQQGVSATFEKTLLEVMECTSAGNDDVHIWQDAVSVLEKAFGEAWAANPSMARLANSMLKKSREIISAQMQRQHRQYVMSEQWHSSRLSLLTARLLLALDESEIYAILSRDLPDMGVHFAWLALFTGESTNPFAWSTVRDLIIPGQAAVCISSQAFPPVELLGGKSSSTLTLIPLVDPSGQTGYMVFRAEHFPLYGAIVQQVSSALNTARLYQQATEGRRLAEEATKMKDRFLSTISHELRNPLNLIVGLSGILLEDNEEGKSPLPDAAQRDIERIQAYAQHLGGLIGDVLDLASSNAGKLRLNMELVDLGEALQMVAESGSQLTADKGLIWQANLPKSGPWVWGDRTRLRQVVLNLINNAIKFTVHGRVSLMVTSNDETVTVRIQDTGLGIPPEEQAMIFDEFQRSERSISLGYSGLGLGLAICKMLIEMQGGTIGVESTGIEGQGSVFYFTLPVSHPPVKREQPAIKTPKMEPTVLVLSSNLSSCDRLCALLEQRGIRVQTALMAQGDDLQAHLTESVPEAIVLDVSISADPGWKTLKAIREGQYAPGTPVMFYTASPDGEALLGLDYLSKPIELAELKQALDQYWFMSDPAHPQRTFLVVDDEPNTLEMHARLVQSHSPSNRVLRASNGREALTILGQEKIDLVLLDLQMPDMDGFDVLEGMRTRESMREVPVIVVTGKELTEADMVRLNQGVAVVLKKGLFGIDETLAHIQAALERKHKLSMDAQRLVRQAMAYLHDHYAEQISRRELAQHVSITEDYLTFCFRQELGITPIKYLQRYRLNQAKYLLKNSQKTITEIALEVGFTDSGYFSRIFHRETGMTPEAFRLS